MTGHIRLLSSPRVISEPAKVHCDLLVRECQNFFHCADMPRRYDQIRALAILRFPEGQIKDCAYYFKTLSGPAYSFVIRLIIPFDALHLGPRLGLIEVWSIRNGCRLHASSAENLYQVSEEQACVLTGKDYRSSA